MRGARRSTAVALAATTAATALARAATCGPRRAAGVAEGLLVELARLLAVDLRALALRGSLRSLTRDAVEKRLGLVVTRERLQPVLEAFDPLNGRYLIELLVRLRNIEVLGNFFFHLGILLGLQLANGDAVEAGATAPAAALAAALVAALLAGALIATFALVATTSLATALAGILAPLARCRSGLPSFGWLRSLLPPLGVCLAAFPRLGSLLPTFGICLAPLAGAAATPATIAAAVAAAIPTAVAATPTASAPAAPAASTAVAAAARAAAPGIASAAPASGRSFGCTSTSS
mmetsp:Transcript_147606/g.374987  ORF Transcript_147606/g.374987 Transcript_147606/m.374987 type:complete len:291 (+) Transcript_147606:18-890(+)